MIKVYGRFSQIFPPDWVDLYLTLESFHPDYEVSVQQVQRKLLQLEQDVKALGFQLTNLQTVDYRITPIYEFDQNVRRLTGFQTTHTLRLSFPLSQGRLNETMIRLQSSPSHPLINLTFTIKEREKLKQKLFVGAIDDAESKAIVIANRLGLKLGSPVKVEEVATPNQRPFRTMAMTEQAVSFTPEGIVLSVELEIHWETL